MSDELHTTSTKEARLLTKVMGEVKENRSANYYISRDYSEKTLASRLRVLTEKKRKEISEERWEMFLKEAELLAKDGFDEYISEQFPEQNLYFEDKLKEEGFHFTWNSYPKNYTVTW